MNTHSQRFHNKIYSIKQKIPIYRIDNWLKIRRKSTLCLKKWQSQGKMCRFLTKIIENSVAAIFYALWKFFHQLLVPQGYSSNFNNCFYHWIEKHGIEVRHDDWLIMVISRQHGNVLSVQLLPSNGSHFLAVTRCALTNAQFTAL